MTRYAEGDWLTAEEIKFLADTSELLNSCVDRRYLQNAVNIIDEDNFHYMELNLAEQIIRKYDDLQFLDYLYHKRSQRDRFYQPRPAQPLERTN